MNPYPSSPTKPPRFELRFLRHGRVCAIHTFYEAYGAKRMFEEVTRDQDFKWLDHNSIRINDELTVRAGTVNQLESIVEYEYANKDEANFEFDVPERRYIQQIITGAADMTFTNESTGETVTAQPKQKKAKQSKRPEGAVTVKQMAEDNNIPASKARANLRKAGIIKPAHGWSYHDPADIERITKIIKGEK